MISDSVSLPALSAEEFVLCRFTSFGLKAYWALIENVKQVHSKSINVLDCKMIITWSALNCSLKNVPFNILFVWRACRFVHDGCSSRPAGPILTQRKQTKITLQNLSTNSPNTPNLWYTNPLILAKIPVSKQHKHQFTLYSQPMIHRHFNFS